jgi:hypothetical protein
MVDQVLCHYIINPAPGDEKVAGCLTHLHLIEIGSADSTYSNMSKKKEEEKDKKLSLPAPHSKIRILRQTSCHITLQWSVLDTADGLLVPPKGGLLD